jgi:hypothetical protein
VNVDKAIKTRPAREPLDTLEACIRDFQWRRAPGGGMDVFADDIPAMCAEAEGFEEAVWIACESRRRNGKMHSHQTKVLKDARRELGHRIIDAYPDIYRWQGWPLLDMANPGFDEFHDFLWEIKPAGIGRLTCYDVATRVGAYLKLEPSQIYLHTGALLGWYALWGGANRAPFGGGRVHPDRWPPALRVLSADMAEDFLCTYRTALSKIRRDPAGYPQ